MAGAAGQRFEARLGGTVRWITGVVCVVLLGTLVLGVLQDGRDAWLRGLMLGLPVAVLVLGWLWRPTGYAIGGEGLDLLRPIGRKRIDPRTATIERDDRALKGAWRTFGNGGLFAVSGAFHSRRLGSFRAWVSDSSRLVVLKSADRTVVISPADPDRFMATWQGRPA